MNISRKFCKLGQRSLNRDTLSSAIDQWLLCCPERGCNQGLRSAGTVWYSLSALSADRLYHTVLFWRWQLLLSQWQYDVHLRGSKCKINIKLLHTMSVYRAVNRVPTGQGNWKKSGNLSGQGKWGKNSHGKIFFFGKVRENEKLVPPDVRFSG